MKINRKYLLCLLALICVQYASFNANIYQFLNTEQLKAYYNEALATEEMLIKAELFKILNITEQEFEYFKSAHYDEYQKASNALYQHYKPYHEVFSKELCTIIERLLLQYDPYDPSKKISVVAHEKISVETQGITILVSEEYINRYCISPINIEAVFVHEIMHIKNQDAFEHDCFTTLFEEKNQGIDTHDWHNVFHKLVCHHEKRADIQAGLENIKYAQTEAQRFSRLICSDIPNAYTHPDHAIRTQYMAELVKHMEQIKYKS